MNRWNEAYNETKDELEKISIEIEKLKNYLYRVSKNSEGERNVKERSIRNNYISELDRLAHVYSKLSSGLRNIDHDIVPLENWREAKFLLEQTFASLFNEENYSLLNSDIAQFGDFNKLNIYADGLIKLLAPYCEFQNNHLASMENSLNLQQHRFNSLLADFKTKISNITQQQEDLLKKSSNQLEKIYKIDDDFKKLNEQYFIGTDEPPLKEKWTFLNEQITKKSNEIDIFYRTLITDKKSIRQEIMSAGDIIQKLRNDSSIAYEKLQDRINDIKVFHQDIYGSDDGKSIGLKSDIDSRRKELTDFEVLQKDKYNALNEQIESLLPGATTAGLSSAYHSLCKSYDKAIKKSTRLFYFSIAFLFVISMVLLTSKLGFSPFNIEFVSFQKFEDIGAFLVYRLPIIIPAVWLAIFASKRRSESERLKQEYAHKEALAKSYQNFKIQIEELGEETREPLMEKLLSSAIDTISNNASLTLDKKHGDSLPLTSLIERTVDKAIEKFPAKLEDK